MKRVQALPFIILIIEKYGKRGKCENSYYEIVGKADLTIGDKKKRCAITAILNDLNEQEQENRWLLVFVVANKFIKSMVYGL